MPPPFHDPRAEHIVVLMMENRSFDHMLGMLKTEEPDLRGITPGAYGNLDSLGQRVPVTDGAEYQGQLIADPGHDFSDVHLQMYGSPFDGSSGGTPAMSGFVKSYEQRAGAGTGGAVMRCFRPEQLPALTTLARQYVVCDQWFSSVPGPTLPNRAFAHFGTSFGRLDMSPDYFRAKPSIYQRLRKAGRSGKIYYYARWSGTQGLTFLLSDQRSYFGLWGDFKNDCRHNRLPDYAFVEPAYGPHGGELATDQHPDHNVGQGDEFIRSVYEAIRANDDCWKSTVLVVVWDEHGGLFDHEVPPAVLPDGFTSTAPPFAFDRLGVRVPAVIISPYVEHRVDHTVYEHASIPATVTEQFLGDPRLLAPYGREKHANTFLGHFDRAHGDPRDDSPDFDAVRAAPPPPPRTTSDDPASSLHVNQVREVHAVLQRTHPELAGQMHPEGVKSEADAGHFMARALEAIHPDKP